MAPNNSHAQLANFSGGAYPYAVCCWSDTLRVLNNSCVGNSTAIMQLQATSDSHVQTGVSSYSYAACLNITLGTISCEYPNDACSSGYSPVVSIASSEVADDNLTNAHVADPSFYKRKICCQVASTAPVVASARIDPTPNAYFNNTLQGYCNATDGDLDRLSYNVQWYLNGSLNVSYSRIGWNATRDLTNLTKKNVYFSTTAYLGGVEIHNVAVDSLRNLTYVGYGGALMKYNQTSQNVSFAAVPASVDGICVDTQRGSVYTVSTFCSMARYNLSADSTTDISVTDTGNWCPVTSYLYGCTVYSPLDLVYIGGTGLSLGVFGVYNSSSNVTTDLRATDTNNWIAGSGVYDLDIDADDALVYLAVDSGKFGYYNISSNVTTNLSGKDVNDWMGTNTMWAVGVDASRNIVYVAGANGYFGLYNRSADILYNLSGTDSGDWIGTASIFDLSVNEALGIVYLAGSSGLFGYYNLSSNTTYDLRNTDYHDWMSTYFTNVAVHNTTNIAFVTTINSSSATFQGFGVYNEYEFTQGFEQLLSTVPSVRVGQNWTLSCQANDSVVVSSWLNSSTTTVIARAPNISSVNISPYPTATIVNDLECQNGTTIDADGDNVSLHYNWFRNNTNQLLFNMPMDWNGSHTRNFGATGVAFSPPNAPRTPTLIAGRVGTGFTCDGINDTLQRDAGTYDGGTIVNFSHSVWIRTGSQSGGGYIVSGGDNSDIRMTGGQIQLTHYNSSSFFNFFMSGHVNDSQWHHITTVVNGSNVTLYVDGAYNNSYTVTNGNQAVRFGSLCARTGTYVEPFNGSVDEYQLWRRALTASEVRTLYATNNRFLNRTELRRGDYWNCSITPVDSTGVNGSTVYSNQTNITNIDPAMQTARISPSPAYRGNTLYGYCNATDTEGDSLVYSIKWFLNGTEYTSATTLAGRNTTEPVFTWLGLGASVYTGAFDSQRQILYFGGYHGLFGKEDYRTNATIGLSTADQNNWFGSTSTDSINALAVDASTGRVYIGGLADSQSLAAFGYYDPGTNIAYNLTGTALNNWLDYATVYALAIDDVTGVVYLGGDTEKFGFYNRSSNVSYDLSSTDSGDWMSAYGTTLSLDADEARKKVYLGLSSGGFGVYNAVDNQTYDLSGTDTGNWIGTSGVNAVGVDDTTGKVYLGISDGKFGVYDPATNISQDLSTVDQGDWIGSGAVAKVKVDSGARVVYIASNAGGAGYFGVYNITSNVSYDSGIYHLNGITDFSFDTVNNLTYVIGFDNTNLIVFNRSGNTTVQRFNRNYSMPSSIYDTALDTMQSKLYISTENQLWMYNISTEQFSYVNSRFSDYYVETVAVDTRSSALYGGGSGGFYSYNTTSGQLYNLSATDVNNWIGTNTVNEIATDSARGLVYLGVGAGLFGVYNRTSNITTNLSGVDVNNWLGTSTISSLAVDETRGLVFITADSGKYGIYNLTSNVSYNLSGTDTGNWVGTNSTGGASVDESRGIFYFSIQQHFGYYNLSSNTTRRVSNSSVTSVTAFTSGLGDSVVDESRGLAFFVGGVGNANIDIPFFMYNLSSNTTIDLSNSDSNNWVHSTDSFSWTSVTIDENKGDVYLGGLTFAIGKYSLLGYFDQGKEQELGSIPNVTRGQSWIFSCLANDGTANSSWMNSSAVVVQSSIPSAPELYYPLLNNITVFERFVTFEWFDSYEFDGDQINYTFNLTVTPGVCSVQTTQSNMQVSLYTYGELCTDQIYNWTVRACDVDGCNTSASNFTVASVAGLRLTTNLTQFGTFNRNQTKATDANGIAPFIVNNTGNVRINITVNGSGNPFSSVALPSSNYQFKAAVNLSNAFNTSGSQTTYTPVDSAYKNLLRQLNYSYQAIGYVSLVNSTAAIDINITVPADEPAGNKQGNITVLAVAG